MAKDSHKETNTKDKSRRSPALALLLVLLIAAAFFMLSDVSFIKSARDAVMQKFGYESVDTETEEPDNGGGTIETPGKGGSDDGVIGGLDAGALPEYNGQHYIKVNGNVPEFPDEVYERAGLIKDGDSWKTNGNLMGTVDSNKLTPYEYYGSLDSLGRCTGAYGCLGEETMPEEGVERGDISSVHPSGWAKAQNWERCHLIAWALSAENANPSNLITGTHYLNYDGMRPLEEEVEHYIWETGNHVLYMAVPWFSGDELVARGVQMTAWSIEDKGEGISFNLYCFNVTPNAEIDYKTGIVTTEEQASQEARLYVVNKRSRVFHYPTCEGAQSISPHNREEVTATRVELTSQGYTPCGACEP